MPTAQAIPVATAEQHEQELAALELTEHPTVQAAYRSVAETWLEPGEGRPTRCASASTGRSTR